MIDDRRLIEDFLPIQAISAEASREKSVRKGHISTLHLWWARRPLVACRAAVYGALVPLSRFRPSNGPEEKRDSLARANAAKFVERLCKYPGSPQVIAEARKHILEAHAERLSKELGKPVTVGDIEEGRAPRPKVLDMFAGGGAIPLEALRLGCEAYALELNPVAHIIELCTLVYPQRYGKPDPNAKGSAKDGTWAGLAEEVRYWGKWVLEKVSPEIGDLYPPIPDPKVPKTKEIIGQPQTELAGKGFDPKGQQKLSYETPKGYLTPVAYLWTRTVRCKNPSCGATVPLVRQTWLCKKKDRYVALKVIAPRDEKKVRFEVVEGRREGDLGFDPEAFSKRGNATCPFCSTVADSDYVKAEGVAGRIDQQVLAIACSNPRGVGNVFVTEQQAGTFYPASSRLNQAEELLGYLNIAAPAQRIVGKAADQVPNYGITTFKDLFLGRPRIFLMQLVAHIRLSCGNELVARKYKPDHAKAVRTALALALDRVANYLSSLCVWRTNRSCVLPTFSRQALAMAWDYGEMNPFSGTAGDWEESVQWVADVLEKEAAVSEAAEVKRGSADELDGQAEPFDVIVTDPPYYDNVIYADLADFFYVWLKLSIGDLYPEHFGSDLSPKRKEIVSSTFRHSTKKAARDFYETMMLGAFKKAYDVAKPGSPLVCVYAHKTTAGWASLVEGLRKAGFTVNEAWPVDTEMSGGMRVGTAALASSIFLVARKREGTETGRYEEVGSEMERIVRERVETLWEMGITGADLNIAAVGAGLRAFTRFARVEYANGEEVPTAKFLTEVEGIVLELLLEKIFKVPRSGLAAVDPASKFYVLWRFQYKQAEIDAGEAIVFAYPQGVELDGARGLTAGPRALVEKKKSKMKLKDYSERGEYEKLGLPSDDGIQSPLIDVLHRSLWLMENKPGKLNEFLDAARPDLERLRLVAQALAGPALQKKDGELGATPTPEQSALGKLTSNWRSLIEENLFRTR